ncbi:stemmadenine O-acetyltransferase-like [Tasmannia lanceolata]|uniref:stemmadenine O-acetyltransferase-like n=1 Tax=Tasmannia lanceolata TaxID=3420 RepID=UPI004062E1D5
MWGAHVIYKDTVRPSSPTPLHLQSFKLSLLDQLAPSFYVPFILFYYGDGNGDNTMKSIEKSQKLKRCLSETLTRFYPLAGRIKEDGLVDCNDEGVDFFEARVVGKLESFLKQPDVEVLNQFVPCNYQTSKSGNDILLGVQVSLFECGGMAIGMSILHDMVDATSLLTLINCWTATARGDLEINGPVFDTPSIFPSRKSVPRFVLPLAEKGKIKRLVFDASKITALRARATEGSPVGRPTTVEAVSSLIWQSVIRVQREEGSMGAYAVMHAVGLRKKTVPPLPDQSSGNIWVPSFSSGILESEFPEENMHGSLVGQVRDAIRKVDCDFVKELQGQDGILTAHRPVNYLLEKYSHCGIGFCYFSSWFKSPIYEADFGWGNPIWVSHCMLPIKNGCFLFGTKSGDGIEAWLNMEEEDMAKLEHDQDLLSFVSSPTIA